MHGVPRRENRLNMILIFQIMLGQGVLRDGRSLHEAYGCDLDKLVEGDRVGVMRTSQVREFFINCLR